jgi:hypothetical protein
MIHNVERMGHVMVVFMMSLSQSLIAISLVAKAVAAVVEEVLTRSPLTQRPQTGLLHQALRV